MKVEDMRREEDVKAEIKKMLKFLGAWQYMHVPMGYGRDGIPDHTAIINGRGIVIEAKFGTNKPSAGQVRELRAAASAGAMTVIVNERGLAHLFHELSFVPAGNAKTGTILNLCFDKKGNPIEFAALARST